MTRVPPATQDTLQRQPREVLPCVDRSELWRLRWTRSFLPAVRSKPCANFQKRSRFPHVTLFQVKRIARVAKRRRDAPGRDGLGQVDWHDEAAAHNVAHLQYFVYICLLSHCAYASLGQAANCLAREGRCGLAGAIHDPFLVLSFR